MRKLIIIIIYLAFFGIVSADASTTISATISAEGVISSFSVSCSGTDATALLVNDFEPFNYVYGTYYPYSVGPYMRRPCINGVASFAEFDLESYLETQVGANVPWKYFYHSPFKLVVKNTTGLVAYDAPDYLIVAGLSSAQNGYSRVVWGIDDNTYPTLAVGPYFDFDDVNWKLYTPISNQKPECCSSVLFIPGLEASRLYVTRNNNTEDQLWEPNSKSDVGDLYLNNDGSSKNSGIYTKDIIKETNIPIPTGLAGQNIYKSFSETMDSLVSDGKISDWKSYAYDWRKGINEIIENGTVYADGNNKNILDVLSGLVASSTNGKVTIIAHSNGGLLAKALLIKLQNDKDQGKNSFIDDVDKVILVAVPEIGTASAVPAILHGFDQRIALGWLMDEIHARELGRNMLGAYGLLPSAEYINRVSASPVTFVDNPIPSGVTTDFVDNYGSSLTSYSSYKNFLFGEEGRQNPSIDKILLPIKLSTYLFSKAEELHNAIDSWTPPENIKVIEVAGWGLDTIASFEYYPKYECNSSGLGVGNCGYVLDERPRFTVDGDKTVVVPSAHYMSDTKSGVEKYWVDINSYDKFRPLMFGVEHKNILEINSLQSFISDNISNSNSQSYEYISKEKPIYSGDRLNLSVHSPITLGAYDMNNNFTGKICPDNLDFCYAEENIPNSTYMEFGEGKYLNLDGSDLQKVVLRGTDIGIFTLNVEKVLPDNTSTSTSFIDIPVTPQTIAEMTINLTTNTPEINMDVNGDGINDINIKSNNSFDPVLYLQVMKKTIENIDINKIRKAILLKRIDDTIKAIQKGKIGIAKFKVELFKKSLNLNYRIIERLDDFKWFKNKNKNKTLTSEEIQSLINMLDNLLNNLNK